MGLLKKIESGSGFLKASFFGEAGSGKTTTAVFLALGTRKLLGLTGPIAFLDSENGSPWVSEWVKKETGQELIGHKSRRFDDLKAIVPECVSMGVSVLIVDSVSHFWDELGTTYLAEINRERRANRLSSIDRLEFQHLNALKLMWGEWTSIFLNSSLHIVTCGRLQNKWEMEENERGKRELVKVGTRMRAEKEFGYEASILVEMSSESDVDVDRTTKVVHTAFVLKDRNTDPATTLTGKSFKEPKFSDFQPHVELLKPAAHVPVDVTSTSAIKVDESGNLEWQRERRQREVVIEEIKGALEAAGLGGTSNEARQTRAQLMQECFGTTSAAKMEQTAASALRAGFDRLRASLAGMTPATQGA